MSDSSPAGGGAGAPEDLSFGVPDFHAVTGQMIRGALARGWQDFRSSWQYGLFFGGFYTLCGLALWQLTVITGQTYWIMLAAFGFPLIGPFAAVGLYEISRLLERGEPLSWGRVLTGVWREKDRQIPSLSAIIIVLFIFWVFIGHVIFALFMGLSVMTNVSSSFEVFLTPNGLMMIAAELLIGGLVALLLYSITVIAMPMLVDREVDFVTAMITSVGIVTRNAAPMLGWAVCIVLALAVGMFPYFFGLVVVLPVLGHATWHLYRAAVV
jgi:uncharacterized membrane protein